MDKQNLRDFRRGTVAFPPTKVFVEPAHDEDEFEEINHTEEPHHHETRIHNRKMSSANMGLLDLLNVEGTEESLNMMVAKVFPPNPLLPKTF